MGILSRLFPNWAARSKQVDVALGLTEYVKKLHAGAILRSGLADEMVEKFERDGMFKDLEHTDIGLTPHAQFFMFNLISHACQEAGLDEHRMGGVVVHVMRETLGVKRDEMNGLMLGYLKWFAEVASEINVAEEAGDPVPDEIDHRVFLESSAAAERFARAMGTDAADPTDEESDFFAALCVSLAPED